ncbi:unnamed protein product [Acanthocheilonema viteae]|uniref:Vesicle transport v-SNARE N-terminal domain-containing protein n=1 Tax=Acanthocheilonema viteae TaxID=6277 RepID=A0A498SG41_ACAVI|nr:unnamed protein product [Acanthocheilonema viteae]
MAANTLLSDFEHQYSVQTAEITARIGRLKDLDKNGRVEGIHQIQRLLVDVENLLEQMELTVRELKPSRYDLLFSENSCDFVLVVDHSAERSKYELRVRSYRNDKKQLDAELDKAVQRLKDNADRDELMTYDNQISVNQIGTEVLNDLNSQRETIMRARERMRQADRDLNRSHKMLSLMIRRIVQNRLLLLIVAVVLLFSLLFIIYKSL